MARTTSLMLGRRVQPLLGAQFVQPLIQIEAALVQQAKGVDPAVVFDLQPDGALAVALVDVDVQGAAEQAGAQQLALPAAQRLGRATVRPGSGSNGRASGAGPGGRRRAASSRSR